VVSDKIAYAYQPNMSGSDGHMLRSASWIILTIVLLLALMTGMQAGKAYARASLATYVTMPPGGWEPGGYNVNGTSAKLIVDTLGWNYTRLMGNVGMGDGSVSSLKQMSNPNVNFSGNNFMAADVSEAPWDPGRITDLNPEDIESQENNTTKNIDNSVNETDGESSVSETKNPENVSDDSAGTGSRQMALNDPYHAILFGRPINDLLYETPLAVPGTAYFRLVGIQMPGGSCLNIGMKTLATGY
jgi:hypothetical protein